jgi:Secretion system C-terminal sorting domain
MNAFSFDWRTSCLHASILNGCLKHSQTYIFTLKSLDDFCPVNGITYQTLSLTVTGPIIQSSGADLYISAPGSTFQWYLDGVAIAGATDSIYTPTVQGIYSVIATNSNGCPLISNALPRTFTSIQTSSLKEFSMNIAPNPIDKNGLSLLISSPTAIQMNVQIVDQLGRSVYNQVVNVNEGNQHIILDPGILASGIYTIQMMNGKNSIEKKFVVN